MKPTENEVIVIKSLPAEERMNYFISRVIDNDEIWSLSDSNGWKKNNISGSQVIQLWPHEEYVEEPNENEKKEMTSLLLFTDQYLPRLINSNIDLEIFPTKDSKGIFITATQFKKILEEEIQANEI